MKTEPKSVNNTRKILRNQEKRAETGVRASRAPPLGMFFFIFKFMFLIFFTDFGSVFIDFSTPPHLGLVSSGWGVHVVPMKEVTILGKLSKNENVHEMGRGVLKININ